MLFDFKTQKWAELAEVGVAYPNWSRDGNYIYFHSFGSDAALIAFGSAITKLEKIVSLKGVRATIGTFGTWCGLAPDDSPLGVARRRLAGNLLPLICSSHDPCRRPRRTGLGNCRKQAIARNIKRRPLCGRLRLFASPT